MTKRETREMKGSALGRPAGPGIRVAGRVGLGRPGAPAALLLAAYLGVVLAPLGLAHLQHLPRRPVADELSSALAMVAFAMLLAEFVISGRFKSVSDRPGIDLTLRFHQLVARTLTAFLLVHPFIYTTPMNRPLPWDATGQMTLGLGTASLITGIAAWILLATLVFAAIVRDRLPYRYETWRFSHGVGALLIAAMGAHHAIDAGRYSGHPHLAGYWLALLGIATFTLLYVYLITPLRQLGRRYRVVSVVPVALRTWCVTIAPETGTAIGFEPGQFCWLTLDRSPFALTEHPFSMSSCPADRPEIAFAIKEVGDFTRRIGEVPVGARAYVDGPHGGLTLSGRAGDGIVFIAGGVGVAPILSMLRQLRAEGDRRPLRLVYGNRVAEQILYRDELDAMSRALALDVHHVLSEPPPGWVGAVGQFDDALLRRLLAFEGRARWLYIVCGPAPMIEEVEDGLARLGVPLRQIVSEKFSYD